MARDMFDIAFQHYRSHDEKRACIIIMKSHVGKCHVRPERTCSGIASIIIRAIENPQSLLDGTIGPSRA